MKIFYKSVVGNILQVISYQDCYVQKSEKTFIYYIMLSLSATIYLCEIENYEMKNLYYLYYFDAYYVPAIIE